MKLSYKKKLFIYFFIVFAIFTVIIIFFQQDREKEYIVKTLGNFTLLAGEALYNDTQLNLTVDQAVFITQIIAEWSFHKSIDLIHSGILPQYWDSIMQKIAFTIFEVAKQAVIRKIPQDQLLQHRMVRIHTFHLHKIQILTRHRV